MDPDALQLTLGEVHLRLMLEPDRGRYVSNGFGNPHSYRAYYDHIAFEPKWNVPIASMIKDVREAIGGMYEGWKGGLFFMNEGTPCNLAVEGSEGTPMTMHGLNALLSS